MREEILKTLESLCIDFPKFQARIKKLEKDREKRLMENLVKKLLSVAPQEWKSFIENYFFLVSPYEDKGKINSEKKVSFYEMIHRELWRSVGIILYNINNRDLQKFGFKNYLDFKEKLPLLNGAWSGIMEILIDDFFHDEKKLLNNISLEERFSIRIIIYNPALK